MKSFLVTLLFLSILGSLKAQSPTMICPGNSIVNSDPTTCGVIVNYTIPTCSSNCIGTTITQTDAIGLTSGDFFPVGTWFIEYTITNGVESSTCIFKVEVLDVTAPVIICPANTTVPVDANCNFIIPNYFLNGDVTATDNCFIDIYDQTPAPGSINNGAGENQLITMSAADSSGNISTCSFTITNVDLIDPTAICPPNQTTPAGINCEGTLQDYIALGTYSDNCDINPIVTQIPAQGTTFTNSITVTHTVVDISGNSIFCSFDVTVEDIQAPSITCPNDTILYVDGSCEYLVADFSGLTTSIDNCDPILSYSQTPIVGSKISGNNTNHFISISVTDASNNTSVCSFNVTLIDTIAPQFGNCNDTTFYLNSMCQHTLQNFVPIVGYFENCSNVATSQVPPIGTIITSATSTPLTLTIQDGDGNVNTCTLNVITVDTISPQVTNCPPNITVNAGANDCLFVLGDYTTGIIANDQCGGAISYSQFPTIGSAVSAGSAQTVTISVADVSNNVSTCSFLVTVNDVTPPELICPLNPSVSANAICEFELPNYQALLNVVDNCGVISSFTQTPPIGTIISGNGTQQLISLFATDQYNNTSSCSFTITVEDVIAPTITCPGNQSVAINSNCQYTIPDFSSLVTVTDFCDGAPIITQSPQVGTLISGIIDVTITATDASGNQASCIFETAPLDTESPSISCPMDIAQCNPIVNYSIPNGFDNCGLVTVTQTDATGLSTGSTFPVGNTILTYQASDIVENTQQCSFTVTIFPEVSIVLPITQTIEEGDTTNMNAIITNGISYVWTPNFYLDADTVMSPNANPTITQTYTVNVVSADGCENSATTTIVVNEIDELIINNFLSPNGDGKNDYWTMNKPSFISGCMVTIFDRWGKQVWQTDQYQNNWKGNNTDEVEMPDGTYFYSIKCAGKDEIKGTILLLR